MLIAITFFKSQIVFILVQNKLNYQQPIIILSQSDDGYIKYPKYITDRAWINFFEKWESFPFNPNELAGNNKYLIDF